MPYRNLPLALFAATSWALATCHSPPSPERKGNDVTFKRPAPVRASASSGTTRATSVEAPPSKQPSARSGPESLALVYGRLCGIWLDGSVRCVGRDVGADSSPHVVLRLAGPIRSLLGSRNDLCLPGADGGMGFYSFGPAEPSLCRPSVPGASQWVALDENASSLCGVRRDAGLWCFSASGPEQTEQEWLASAREEKLLTSAEAVVAGTGGFFCGLKRDGSVWCWGKNDSGALGDGSFRDSSVPMRARLPLPASLIAAGNGHVCALLQDQSVNCWGEHVFGQLGIGRLPPSGDGDESATRLNPTRYNLPQRVSLPVPVQRIAASADATCAQGRDGRLWCWGANSGGLLLGGGNQPGVAQPTLIEGLSPVHNIVSEEGTFCILDGARQTWCWGYAGGLLAEPSPKPVAIVWD